MEEVEEKLNLAIYIQCHVPSPDYFSWIDAMFSAGIDAELGERREYSGSFGLQLAAQGASEDASDSDQVSEGFES